MFAFAVSLIRPYWNRMAALFAAMLVETAMGLATLWPLKIVLDSVFDTRPLAPGVSWLMAQRARRWRSWRARRSPRSQLHYCRP